jgi:hypothetical protein
MSEIEAIRVRITATDADISEAKRDRDNGRRDRLEAILL